MVFNDYMNLGVYINTMLTHIPSGNLTWLVDMAIYK